MHRVQCDYCRGCPKSIVYREGHAMIGNDPLAAESYLLEPLEPRVLLSSVPMADSAGPESSPQHVAVISETATKDTRAPFPDDGQLLVNGNPDPPFEVFSAENHYWWDGGPGRGTYLDRQEEPASAAVRSPVTKLPKLRLSTTNEDAAAYTVVDASLLLEPLEVDPAKADLISPANGFPQIPNIWSPPPIPGVRAEQAVEAVEPKTYASADAPIAPVGAQTFQREAAIVELQNDTPNNLSSLEPFSIGAYPNVAENRAPFTASLQDGVLSNLQIITDLRPSDFFTNPVSTEVLAPALPEHPYQDPGHGDEETERYPGFNDSTSMGFTTLADNRFVVTHRGVQALANAIEAANARPGLDVITFNIGGGGHQRILFWRLPEITDTVIIDGTTQPGFAGTPIIELTGINREYEWPSSVFRISASNCIIRGLVINGASTAFVINGSDNTIAGNFIGTDVTGLYEAPREINNPELLDPSGIGTAVRFQSGFRNVIGGVRPEDRNLIAASITDSLSTPPDAKGSNIIQGNLMGLNITGRGDAISRDGISLASENNQVGGTAPGAGNVIYGGVNLNGNHNVVEGNIIGLDATGTQAIPVYFLQRPPYSGIFVGGTGNVVGGTLPESRNIISGYVNGIIVGAENRNGVTQPAGSGNKIIGNFIGTDIQGRHAFGNLESGVVIEGGALETEIRGNVISGNGLFGVRLRTGGSDVVSNLIGVAEDGVTPLGNGGTGPPGGGILIESSENLIGGLLSEANRIAFNLGTGVSVRSPNLALVSNLIERNEIYSNSGLGIDWDGDGLPIEPQPIYLISATLSGQVLGSVIGLTLGEVASVNFYSSLSPDPTGFGEGETFLGETTIVGGTEPTTGFAFLPPVELSEGEWITATLTDGTAGTSEFSKAIQVTARVNSAPTIDPLPHIKSMMEDALLSRVDLSGIGDGDEDTTQAVTLTARSSDETIVPHPVVTYFQGTSTASLEFAPLANAVGRVTITLTLTDDGGTENGGNDTRVMRFEVEVVGVNDAPRVGVVQNLEVDEDSTPTTIILDLSPGPAEAVDEAGQVLTVTVIEVDPASNASVRDPQAFFDVAEGRWKLRFTPAENEFGTTTIKFNAVDSGGRENGGQDTTPGSVVVTVRSVNDPPVVNEIARQTIVAGGGLEVGLFGIGSGPPIREGPTNESNDGLVVTATVDGPHQDVVTIESPYISGNDVSVLSLRALPSATGTATVTVTVTDGEGATFSRSFEVTIIESNRPPTITAIGDHTIKEDGSTGALGFTIGDPDTPIGALNLTATSSDPDVLPLASIVLLGEGENRTLTLTPRANRFTTTAPITIVLSVSDGEFNASTSFTLSVNAVNDPPTMDSIPGLPIRLGSAIEEIVLSGISAGPEEAGQSIVLSADSSESSKVQAEIVYSSPESVGRLRLLPQPGARGELVVTLTLRDSGGTANSGDDESMILIPMSVAAAEVPPTLDPISNVSIDEDSGEYVVGLVGIGFGRTPEAGETLQITAVSGLPDLTGAIQVLYSSPNSTGELRFTPAPNANSSSFGPASIDVTVERLHPDGRASPKTARRFLLTVSPVNDPPLIGPIADMVLEAGVPNTVLNLTGISAGPAEEANEPLNVTAISGNEGVVVVSILPADGVNPWRLSLSRGPDTGASEITVTVNDGGLSAKTTLRVTIVTVPAQLSWDTPGEIVYGTPLGPDQLNATADVLGNMTYSLPAGTVLHAGNHALTATFTPSDGGQEQSIWTVISVRKQELIVEADDKTIQEGDPLPALTTTFTGLVNGDTRESILLPVLLNTLPDPRTVTSAFVLKDIKDPAKLLAKLKAGSDPVSTYLLSRFSEASRSAVLAYPESETALDEMRALLLQELNSVLNGESVYESQRFAGVQLRGETAEALQLNPQGEDLKRLNRLLLEDVFPVELIGAYVIVPQGPSESANYTVIYLTGEVRIAPKVVGDAIFELGDFLRLTIQAGSTDVVAHDTQLRFLQFPDVEGVVIPEVRLFRDSGLIDGFEIVDFHGMTNGVVRQGNNRVILQFDQLQVDIGSLSLRRGVLKGEVIGGGEALGKVTLSAVSVPLFPNEIRFGGVITNGGGAGAGFIEEYEAATGKQSIQAKELVLRVKGPRSDILSVTARDVDLGYQPTGPPNQLLAKVSQATVKVLAFGDKAIVVSGLEVRANGFSVASVSASLGTLTLGGFLQLEETQLALADLGFELGTAPLGTMRLSATAGRLYPGTRFQAQITDGNDSDTFGVVAAYQWDADRLSAGLDQFRLTAEGWISVNGSGLSLNYPLDPAPGDELLRVASQSIKLLALGGAEITAKDFVLRRNGFSLGTTEANAPRIQVGSFLAASGVSLKLTGIEFVSGSAPKGTIELAAVSAQLFPEAAYPVNLVDSADQGSEAIGATYDLASATLKLRIERLNWEVPQVLRATASTLELTYVDGGAPDQELLRAQSLNVAFLILGGATIDGVSLTIRRNGFSLGNLQVVALGTVRVGGFLEIPGATLTLTDIAYVSGGQVSGSIGFSSILATLFPGGSFSVVVSDGNDTNLAAVRGEIRLPGTAIGLELDQLKVEVNAVLAASAAGGVFRYDPNLGADQLLATIPEANVKLLAFESREIKLRSWRFRANGFSFENATTTLGDTSLGGFLWMRQPTLVFANIEYTTGLGLTGGMEISTDAAQLFPGVTSPARRLTDGPDADRYVLAGRLDLASGVISVLADELAVEAGGLALSAQAVEISYAPGGPDDQAIVSVATLDLKLEALGFTGTAFELQITKRGDFGVSRVILRSSGFLKSIGLGEFLPFEITNLDLRFHGDANRNGRRDPGEVFQLTEFDLEVSGHFDFTKLGKLPFKPTLRIGPAEQQQVLDDASDVLAFTVTIENGSVRPKDVGPIEIGVAELRIGGAAELDGAILLGGYRDGTWTGDYSGTLNLRATGNLKDIQTTGVKTVQVAFDNAERTLRLRGVLPVSFSLGQRVRVTGARLDLELDLTADADFDLQAVRLKLHAAAVQQVELSLGSLMTLSATQVELDLSAGADEFMASFGTLRVSFPGLGIQGTGRNFAIRGDGSVASLPNFGVSLDIDSGALPSLKWPSWLHIRLPKIEINWPNFELNPEKFRAVVSAIVDRIENLPLQVSGSIEDIVIDFDLLRQGKFPVMELGSASITIKGKLFGGDAEGTLFVGLIRVDAAGNRILPGDEVTPVADRVLYGGIMASFKFGDLSGFQIRIGLSERGPLGLYVLSSTPILLEPISGLTITDLRAGVMFHTVLPSITNPLDLTSSAFKPQVDLSVEQWKRQLEAALLNQVRGPPSDFWDAFNHPMKIEGGATLYSIYLTRAAFEAKIDLIFSTDGKFLANARMVFGGAIEQRAILYADLSKIRDRTGAILYLSETPVQSPVLVIRGRLVFKYTRLDGSQVDAAHPADAWQLSISGAIELQALNATKVSVEGEIELTVSPPSNPTRFDLRFSGELKLTVLGRETTIASAAGVFHLDTSRGGLALWGAAALSGKLGLLKNAGLFIDGTSFFLVNLTGDTYRETLVLPGVGNIDLTLKPKSVGFQITGEIQFRQSGLDWFILRGTFAIEVSSQDGLSIFADGSLILGTRNSSLLFFDFTGFLQINSRGVVALFDLQMAAGLPEDFGLSFAATFTLYLNTTSQDVTYYVPAVIETIPGDKATRAIVVPGGPAGKPYAPYLEIRAVGILTLLKAEIQGTFYLYVSPGVIQLEVAGALELKAGGISFLTFDVAGGFLIDEHGVVAVVALGVRGSPPGHLGLELDLDFRLEVNTTRERQIIAGFELEAGRFVRIRGEGSIKLLGLKATGTLEFTFGEDLLRIYLDATVDLKAGASRLASFWVLGALQVDSRGIAGVIQLSVEGDFPAFLGFKFDVTGLRLEVNTTGEVREFGGITLEAGRFVRVRIAGSLQVGPLRLQDGVFILTIADTYVQVDAVAKLELVAGGTRFWSFDARGGLRLDQRGIAGLLALDVTSQALDGLGFSADLTFLLSLNTTNRVLLIAGVMLPANSVTIEADGSLKVLEAVELQGHFSFRILPDRAVVRGDLTLKLLSQDFRLVVDLALLSDGLVVRVRLGVPSISLGFVSVQGNQMLELNTTQRQVLSVPRQTARICISNARVSLAGLTLSGSLCIGIVEGGFEISVPASDPLMVDIAGVLTAQVSGFIRSGGEFSLTGSATARFGSRKLIAIEGFAALTISNRSVVAALDGVAYILDQRVADIFGRLEIVDGHFNARLGTSVKFVVLDVLRVEGRAEIEVSDRGLRVEFGAAAKLFNSIGVNVHVVVDTIRSIYEVTGGVSFQIGGSSLGMRLDVGILLSNYRGVNLTVSGSAWAKFRIFGKSIGPSVGFRGEIGLDGRVNVRVEACIRIFGKKKCAGVTVHVDLKNGFKVWKSDISGSTVFLDANNNGTLDPGEPITQADEDGLFSFADTSETTIDPVEQVSGLGRLQSFDTNGNGTLDPDEGQLYVLGGTYTDPDTGDIRVGDQAIDSLLIQGFAPAEGATAVFFDVNRNGQLDAGELSASPDESGFFTFYEKPLPGINDLGRLAPFDLNGNGRIDLDEGQFIVMGGVDRNTGLPNTQVTKVPAVGYGSGLSWSVNPLADLRGELVNAALNETDANQAVVAAFGIPGHVDVALFDPRSQDALEPADLAEMLRATGQLNTFLLTGGAVLDIDADEGQEALSRALVQDLARVSLTPEYPLDANGEPIYFSQIDLADSATLRRLLSQAALDHGAALNADQLQAVADIIASINQSIARETQRYVRDGAVAQLALVTPPAVNDLQTALAGLKALSQTSAVDAIKQIRDSVRNPADVAQGFSGQNLEQQIRSRHLPPYLSKVDDVTTNGEPISLRFTLENPNQLNAELSLVAQSTNLALLPPGSMTVSGNGVTRTLTIQPAAGGSGETVVTLVATLRFVDGRVLVSEEHFTLTVASINLPPDVGQVAPQVVPANGQLQGIGFVVGDFESEPTKLFVTASSSNESLIPSSAIVVEGQGSARTITLVPSKDRSGFALVTLAVSDGFDTTVRTFPVTVLERNDPPILELEPNPSFFFPDAGQAFAIIVPGNSRHQVMSILARDRESPSEDLILSVSFVADNAKLLSPGSLDLGGTAATRALTVVPNANQSGTALVTLSVSDGVSTTTRSFTLIVDPFNETPVVLPIDDLRVQEGRQSSVTIQLSDDKTPIGNLKVTALSSNPDLLPAGGLRVVNNRTLEITPAIQGFGVTTITLNVSDGATTSSTTFKLFVYPRNTAPTLNPIGDQIILENRTTDVIQLTIGDRETPAGLLAVNFLSSNQTVLPLMAFRLEGIGAQRHLVITPALGQSGASDVSLTVSDGELTTTSQFHVTVEPNTLRIVRWESTAYHGAELGTIGLEIPQPAVFSEPRFVGINTIEVTFSQPIDPTSFTPDRIEASGFLLQDYQPVDLAAIGYSTWVRPGNLVGVIVFGEKLPDIAQYRIEIQGVRTPQGDALVGANVRVITALLGDVNGDFRVDNSDLGAAQSLRGSPRIDRTDSRQVRVDVNVDGRINNSDVGGLLAQRGHNARGGLKIVEWQSLAPHGNVSGELGLVIPDDGGFSEPRQGGIRKLQIRFSQPIEATSFTPAALVIDGVLAGDGRPIDLSGLQISTTLSNDNLVGWILFPAGLPDLGEFQVSLRGVRAADGLLLEGDNDRTMAPVFGDVNGDRRVNNSDVGGIKSLFGNIAVVADAPWTVRSDLNRDGRVDGADADVVYLMRGRDARRALPPLNAVSMSATGSKGTSLSDLVEEGTHTSTSALPAALARSDRGIRPSNLREWLSLPLAHRFKPVNGDGSESTDLIHWLGK